MSWQGGTGASPAPGWYPDPGQRFEQRYWDGGRWTEHVIQNGQPATDQPPGARPETPDQATSAAQAAAQPAARTPEPQGAQPEPGYRSPQEQGPREGQAPPQPHPPQQAGGGAQPWGQQAGPGQAPGGPGQPPGGPWGGGPGFQPAPRSWTNRAFTGRYTVPGHVFQAPSAAAAMLDRRSFGKGLVQTLAVLGFLLALVLGTGLFAVLPGASAGTPVDVAPGLRVQPLSGWTVAEQTEGDVMLSRGAANLHILTESGVAAGQTDQLIVAYLSGLKQGAKGGDIPTDEPQDVTLPNGLKARRVHFQAQFDDGPAVTVQGEITAVISNSGLGIVFDGFSSPDIQPYSEGDVHQMIDKAVIS